MTMNEDTALISQERVMEIRGVAKTYGSGESEVTALRDITFDVNRGELVSVVGPSGCGKTTLLKIIAGLLDATSGEVVFEGKKITSPPDHMAVVFQDYSSSLMPWMSVGQNIALPLRRKKSRDERDKIVARSAESVGLSGFLDHYPWQLSGGMQQRVAIARALAYEPALLLMDEPFASVDAQTRSSLEDLTLALRQDSDIAILLVTHDIDEAVYMADRLVQLTPRPTVVERSIKVDLPHPRNQVTTKELSDFGRLRSEVHAALMNGAPGR